ncbi:hypothetical protein GGP77_000388 [Salinibacter ruber]|uniref:hypothetical protein n=1 Tax=Salinibacter ruber TaxID=146919 RepID=UPI001F07BCE1|nr:hypothetical protein [Salinibacter ruber]MCS3666187.1 hypothetical protein [Salinibacter ruber]
MTPASARPVAPLLCPALLELLLVVASGCATSADAPGETEDTSPARQTAFRVRSDVGAGLNADRGWAGP